MMDESNRSLDKLADEFEAIWARGTRPDIAEFLDRVESPQRAPLAALLIPIDARFRQRSGEPIHVDDYAKFAGIDANLIEPLLRAVVPESAKSDPVKKPSAQMTPVHSIDEQDLATQVPDNPALYLAQEPRRMIGPYKLLRRLGEGGMGEVWMAEQSHPVKRRVALKLIKAGIGSREVIARFEAERQALALMNHPNIARILDIGATEQGQPYFVMELVTGTPLTLYCDDNQLSIDDRLELFTQVCAGVQHAHQKGIIHRDLKPGNIIVGIVDGLPVPKVIDFGLAKATESIQRLTDKSVYTEVGQILGTLKYMSPEQASLNNLDIDTRTDIYSLGIILYELLTGSTPLDSSSIKNQAMIKVLELIRDKEPVKPSSKLSTGTSEQVSAITNKRRTDPVRLNRLLQGDLDWIVMKALETDRSRRYESASGFAADIGRYLSGDAVTARPPSWNYRVRKFVRKNRAGVIAAALLGLTLLAGLLGTSYGLYRANRSAAAEQIAKQDAQKREAEAVEQRKRAETREKEALRAFEQLLEIHGRQTREHPSVTDYQRDLAGSYLNIGILLRDIGKPTEALRAYEQALKIQKRMAREHPTAEFQSAVGATLNNLALLQVDDKKFAEARDRLLQAIEYQRQALASNPSNPEYRQFLGNYLTNLTKAAAGLDDIALARKAREGLAELAIFDPANADHNERITAALEDAASDEPDQKQEAESVERRSRAEGREQEALWAFEQVAEIQHRMAREHPAVTEFQSDLATSHSNIGILLSATGKPTEALRAYEQALEIRERLALEHPTVTQYQSGLAECNNSIGALLLKTGKPIEALRAFEQALEIQQLLVREHPTVTEFQSAVGVTLNHVARQQLDDKRFAEAADHLLQAIEYQQRAMVSNRLYRQLLRDHLTNLARAAAGLDDVDLARKARAGLAELTISDPANAELNERITAVQDDAADAKPDELLKLGKFGYDTLRFVPATQMYAQALANQPDLAENRQSQIAYNAACCAAMAASESGLDNPPLDDAAKEKLRAQALDWLQAELDRWEKFAKAERDQSPTVERTLRHWQQDTDLTSVRDPDQLKNLPETERAAWQKLWQRVRKTLDSSSAAPSPADDSLTEYVAPLSESGKSRIIGNYKLLQKLGEGGMGTVWIAEQERPVRRRVALKLIKAGNSSREIIARFEVELQALAMMDHQNIAKVLDAGTTEQCGRAGGNNDQPAAADRAGPAAAKAFEIFDQTGRLA